MSWSFSLILGAVVAVVLAMLPLSGTAVQSKPATQPLPASPPYAGSKSCIACHSKFYQLWSSSRHGLAMQPYTAEFARAKLAAAAYNLCSG